MAGNLRPYKKLFFPDHFTPRIFKMRITLFEKTIIKSSVKRHFGGNADVYLFGSRVDDNKKGGDIDLYVTTDLPTSEIILEKISLLLEIERELGEQKIDVVINNHTRQKPIYEIAEKEGVRL
jgi:predicted nucleotidyltransferase